MSTRRPATATALIRIAFSTLLLAASAAVLLAGRADAQDPINPQVAGLPWPVEVGVVVVGLLAITVGAWSVVAWTNALRSRRTARPIVVGATPSVTDTRDDTRDADREITSAPEAAA